MNTITLRDLQTLSAATDEWKSDYVHPANEYQFVDGKLVIPGNSAALTMSQNAMSQMATKLGPSVWGAGSSRQVPMEYLTKLPTDLQDLALNHHLGQNNQRWMVRGYHSPDGGSTARAFLAGDYPKVSNTRIIEMANEALQAGGMDPDSMKIVRHWVNADSVNVQIQTNLVNVPKNGHEGGDYGMGVSFSNNETGNGGLSVAPFIYRLVCRNGLIAKTPMASMQLQHHRAYTPKMMLMQFAETLAVALKLSEEALEKLLEAELTVFPNFNKIVNGLAKNQKWSQEVITSVAIGSEGKQTHAGLVNGITYAAHRLYQDKPEQRVAMEEFAGEVLYWINPTHKAGQYARIAGRAQESELELV